MKAELIFAKPQQHQQLPDYLRILYNIHLEQMIPEVQVFLLAHVLFSLLDSYCVTL